MFLQYRPVFCKLSGNLSKRVFHLLWDLDFVMINILNYNRGQVAQLVEQRTENPCVGGSNPLLPISFSLVTANAKLSFFMPNSTLFKQLPFSLLSFWLPCSLPTVADSLHPAKAVGVKKGVNFGVNSFEPFWTTSTGLSSVPVRCATVVPPKNLVQ